MSERFTRTFNATSLGVESRAGEGEDKQPRIVGYAAVFDRDSSELGWGDARFIERIAPGAFKDTLRSERTVWATFNHNHQTPFASTRNGSIEMEEDDHGLRVLIEPNMGTSAGRDAVALVERGDADKMSFTFTLPEDGDSWERGEEGEPDRRTIHRANLHEVSVVVEPAYADTEAVARSHDLWVASQEPSSPSPEERRKAQEQKQRQIEASL